MPTDDTIDLFESTAELPPEPTDDVDEIDADFAPRPKQRLGKSTVLLAAVLLAGLGFIGGVQVQKSRATTGTQAGALPGGGNFRGGNFPGGAFPSGLTLPGGFNQPGTGQGSASTPSGPAVIGTVVSVKGNTLTVKNFAGKTITVTLADDTPITQTVKAAALRAGQSVTVSGTTGADGKVTATQVTAR